MAEEATGTDSSSDDSLSEDESSYRLHFDLPNNDQTWLFCPPGEDPNSTVDLTEWLNIRPSFTTKLAQNTYETEEAGHIIDTRTFTRPKKQSILASGINVSPKDSDINLDMFKHKAEITTPTKIPFLTTPGRETGTICSFKSEFAELQQNKENLIISPFFKKNTNKLTPNLSTYNAKDNPNQSIHDIKKPKSRINDEITLLENISHPQSFFIDYSLSDSCSKRVNASQKEKNPQETLIEGFTTNLNSTYDKPCEEETLKNPFVSKTPLVPTPISRTAGVLFKPTLVSTPKSSRSHSLIDLEKQDFKPKKADYTKSDKFYEGQENTIVNLDETFIASNSNKKSLITKPTLVMTGSNESLIKSCNEASKKTMIKSKLPSFLDTTYLVHDDCDIKTERNIAFDPNTTISLVDYILESQECKVESSVILKPTKVTVSKMKEDINIEKAENSCKSSIDNLDVCRSGEEQESRLKDKTIRQSVSHETLFVQPESDIANKVDKKKQESVATLRSCSTFKSGLKQPTIRFKTGEGLKQPAIRFKKGEGLKQPTIRFKTGEGLKQPAIRFKKGEGLEVKTLRKSVSHESLLIQPEPAITHKTEKKKHESVANLTSFMFTSGLKEPSIRFKRGEAEERFSAKSFVSTCKPAATSLPLQKGGSLLQKPFYSVKKLQKQSISKSNESTDIEQQSHVVQKDEASGIKPTTMSRIPRGITKIPKPKKN